MEQELTAVWTYRSFLNTQELGDDFKNIKFGEGELVIERGPPGVLRGQLAFRSSPPKPDDARLTLTGSLQAGSPATLRFQGVGVPGTLAEGWVYDYICYLTPHWPDGIRERRVLVGSVIRTVAHSAGKSPAGVVASFVAVQRDFLEPSRVIPLAQPVLTMLASREHRLQHMIWHGLRGEWFDQTPETQKTIAALGWEPPRKAITVAGAVATTNNSGEDFLFMHRQMILMVNDMMKQAKLPPIKGWGSIPPPEHLVAEPDFSNTPPTVFPGNPRGFTIPPAWIDPTPETDFMNRRIAALKSDEYFWSRMRSWEREYRNPQYLQTLTLGELGALLEFTVHNDMHMRWCSVPRDPQTGDPVPAGRQAWDISKNWDLPAYDYLGEFYSSHVNPVFWRLHGWIDDRIADWFAAHEEAHPGEIQKMDVDGTPWFKPGKWVKSSDPWAGPPQPKHGGGHGHHGGYDVPTMEKVAGLLYPPPPPALAPEMKLLAAASVSAQVAGIPRQWRKATWFE